MKVGVIGSGVVAQVLGTGFVRHGHEVMLGTRDSSKLESWKQNNPPARVGSFAEAASFGELVVLAVKGAVAVDVLRAAGADNFDGKTIIDTCNPIADEAIVDGVMKFFLGPNESLMQQLQSECPDGRFVKCFSCVGSAHMVNPQFRGGPPTMFICGNDEGAKKIVRGVLDQFGWETADMGTVEAARAIEPLCILWCIPGFAQNEWNHAFKLLH